MASETAQILAVWKERPSFFTSGMMQWVADSVDPAGSHRVADSPAFPLDDAYVTADGSNDDSPYIHVRVDAMDVARRGVVEQMHEEFVKLLEHQGWARTGQGDAWYNLHVTREINASTPASR